ncbi:MAG TPA: hypothetical protein VGG97_18420 [Bryobacteraceae bacterium]|jgi:hypothetical protein
MTVDWDSLLKTIGGGGIALTVAAWLIRAIVTDRLKANTDAEIVRLKSSLDRDIKLFEVELKSNTEAEVEKLKHSLQITADSYIERLRSDLQMEQLRFSRLHEKRGKVIAEIYKRLVNVELEGKKFIYQLGRCPKDEDGNPRAIVAIREFESFVDQHRIYLSERVCELVGGFSALLKDPVVHALVYGDIERPNPQTLMESHQGFKKAFEMFASEIPAARRELEREFRQILGVT